MKFKTDEQFSLTMDLTSLNKFKLSYLNLKKGEGGRGGKGVKSPSSNRTDESENQLIIKIYKH